MSEIRNLDVYQQKEIAEKYRNKLDKRKGLCSFDERYIKLNIKRGFKILDLGCGTGRHILKFGKVANFVGVDISPHMIQIAKSQLNKRKIKSKLIVGDMMELDKILKNEKFDMVLLMYHTLGCIVPERKRISLLKQIKKLLKKDGILILHAHNRNHLKNIKFIFKTFLNVIFNKDKLEFGDKLIEHGELTGAIVHFFNKQEIKRILELTGFKIIEFIHLEFPEESKEIKGLRKYFFSGGFMVKANAL